MLDILLSQDEFGRCPLRSGVSLSDVQGLNMPCRLMELSRDSVRVLSVVEGGAARAVLRRRRDEDSRRSNLSVSA